jgi:hypothetical protein
VKDYLYCPKCHGEFRDWVEVCPQCRVHLVQDLPPVEWWTKSHIIGVVFGMLTLLAGAVGIVPEGIIGPFRLHIHTAQMWGNIFAMLLVAFVSALLCSPDRVYRRLWVAVLVGAAIAAAAGTGLVVASFRHPYFQEPTFGAGLYKGLAFLAGLWALTDSAVLCGRLWWARRVGKARV